MEMYKATVVKEGDNHYIKLIVKSKTLSIPMTEDLPNEIKDVFNQLILLLKTEQFNFKCEDVESDLFSQVAVEYIKQLNKELNTVYSELSDHGLLIAKKSQ